MLNTLVDGVVGWRSVGDDTLMIDARQGIVLPLTRRPNTSIPDGMTNWAKFKILTNSGVLRLEPLNPDGRSLIIFVDTGSEYGVGLAPDQWREWKAVHTNQPLTLDAYYSPHAGTVVAEESWAKSLAIGELLLKDVPIKEADKAEIAFGSVTLGLAALECMDFIIDAREGYAFLRTNRTPPPPYDHNRLGAVFTPVDMQSEDLVARVVRNSPAWEAGIRNGDVLTRIGELDVTKWRTDPAVLPLGRFWERAAGTKLELTLRRGKEVFKTEVVLRQILPPETSSSESVSHE